MRMMETKTLLERCRRGDEAAWEALVRRFQGRIYGIAYCYVGNPEEARDLAQDIFVRLYDRLDACTNDETFVPWLIRLARNACIDRIRRMRARPRPAGVPVDEMFDLPAPGPDPEDQRRITARRELIHRALRRLSAISREIILLREIQGLSLEEIAGTLEIPIGTVKSRTNRARIELAREVTALARPEEKEGV
ncbi:MAG: sigma-70 family RNA polymerase sigma factor [Candidatus Eisenbacteria bacterium]|nr:sigma-70 family RNA polymerase sigma factor [Candidatus Latescibacterota bacterium]MBD3302543.1 sigma-70 family RNA polymerase sigma factor [Candidatus Eisenbacteria bacterium]